MQLEKCERCGCNFVKKDDCDVCGVCLDELEEDEKEEFFINLPGEETTE